MIETGFSDDPKHDALVFSRAGIAGEKETIEILEKKESKEEKSSPENPEQLERNKLVEEHRRLDAEFDVVESEIDSFFRRPGPYRSPEDDAEISGLIAKREKILEEIRKIEQALLDLDTK